ncbi:MAG: hypothetical protein DDT40_01761 [candidate division WS2 bacterium]|nr:hypothetical protein [Candidatus Psychracetigena formicireducens]
MEKGKMEKIIFNLLEEGDDPERDDEPYLRVVAFRMNPEQHKEVREELDRYGLMHRSISADLIIGELKKTINPNGTDTITIGGVLEVIKKLEENGWDWLMDYM